MLGHKIRLIRLKKGIRAKLVAGDLGMSYQGYSRIERNEVDVNYENLKIISDTLQESIKNIEDYEDSGILPVESNSSSIGLGMLNYYENRDLNEMLLQIIETQKEMLSLLKTFKK